MESVVGILMVESTDPMSLSQFCLICCIGISCTIPLRRNIHCVMWRTIVALSVTYWSNRLLATYHGSVPCIADQHHCSLTSSLVSPYWHKPSDTVLRRLSSLSSTQQCILDEEHSVTTYVGRVFGGHQISPIVTGCLVW